MLRGRKLAVIACAAALTLNAGCYAYQPMVGATPTAERRIRLELTPDGTTEMARYLGPRVVSVEGSFAGTAPDGAMRLGVEWVQLAGGGRQPWTGEGIVSFPTAYVGGVQQHALQRGTSILAAAALAGALLAVAVLALGVGGSQGGDGTGAGGPPP